MSKKIDGFSRMTKSEKIDWITNTHFSNVDKARRQLESYWNLDFKLQTRHDEFIENSLSNFYLPLGVAPNFLINGTFYTLPMVTEESSVVAAAANSAKFWSTRGGFKTKILDTLKVGQIHFLFEGNPKDLLNFFNRRKSDLMKSTSNITKNMRERGGGIMNLSLVNKGEKLPYYYQLHLDIKTGDAMGANFINSCLEHLAKTLVKFAKEDHLFKDQENPIDVLMSILSNYVPQCVVQAQVSCAVNKLYPEINDKYGYRFAKRIIQAVEIAKCEPYRAVTHNKGIMNGVDALIIATGNDFRAVEAGVHAYAARSGKYSSLSDAYIKDDKFIMELSLPLAVGTIGGLTQIHPMVSWCLELIGKPSAEKLMEIIAVAGLAQNFAALQSLVTEGIQKGHMKMHLLNILNQFNADEVQKKAAISYFKNNRVSVKSVEKFLQKNKL